MAEERLEEIRAARLARRQALLEAGRVPYPAEARRTHTTAEALADFETLESGRASVVLAGRVVALRRHGSLAFLDLQDSSGQMQLQISEDAMPAEIFARLENIDAGDFVQAAGPLGKTKRGAKSLLVSEFHTLAKSIRPLPSAWHGLKDHEARFRQRELDLLLNTESRSALERRGEIVDWWRGRLKRDGFREFETPLLQTIPGGAAAQPFLTHHNALDIDLYLRIAPELYLKRLLVAGFEKVFELGRNFRNEGIDKQHNPEFTMLEFYWAYADYEDLMDYTEQTVHDLVVDVTGAGEIQYGETQLSFAKPWDRVRFIDLFADRLEIDILEEKDPARYAALFRQHNLEMPAVQTYAKLVDELYKELIRPTLVQPTLVYDYPVELVPLAKQSLQDPRVVEMFQLLVGGFEVVKAYTELNDPVIQRERFEQQALERRQGDTEAAQLDEDYLRAMEQGMPPAAGWGLGVDRLTALLTNSASIRETIAFPLMRPEN